MNIKGTVSFNYYQANDGKQALYLIISEETEAAIREELEKNHAGVKETPLKDTDEGLRFKTSSKFPVKIYENAELLESDDPDSDSESLWAEKLSQIGEGSEIVVNVKFQTVKYKGNKTVSAYLKAVNILSFVEKEEYNPFAE